MLYNPLFYNPLWSQPEQKFGTIAHFSAWLSSQPQDTTYHWETSSDCLVCRYALAHGRVRLSDNGTIYGLAIGEMITEAPYREVFAIHRAAYTASYESKSRDGATYAQALNRLSVYAAREHANAVQS